MIKAKNNVKANFCVEQSLSYFNRQIANVLQTDRCFLYVRDPKSRYGQAAFCFCRNPKVPDVSNSEWEQEQPDKLEAVDPMFAAALNCQPSIYVEDVETADPETLNRDFEAQEFGHRALIHGHICLDGQLWGIIQPCVFDRPRQWTTGDKQVMAMIIDRLTPLVKEYVLANIQSVKQKYKQP